MNQERHNSYLFYYLASIILTTIWGIYEKVNLSLVFRILKILSHYMRHLMIQKTQGIFCIIVQTMLSSA